MKPPFATSALPSNNARRRTREVCWTWAGPMMRPAAPPRRRPSRARLQYGWEAIVGFPVFVYGAVVNALPYYVPRWLSRRLARKGVEMIFFHPQALCAGGALERVPVQVGLTDGSFTEILAGPLKADDRVATAIASVATAASRTTATPLAATGARGGPGTR